MQPTERLRSTSKRCPMADLGGGARPVGTPVAGGNGFSDVHVVVTGAAGGIGLGICEAFAAQGAVITGVDLRPSDLEDAMAALAARYGRAPRALAGDLADEVTASHIVEEAWDRRGPVDVLVNAAGIYPATPFLELSARSWDHVQAVNVRAAMLATRSLAARAVATGRPACTVNISSGAALRARQGAAHYCTSKAALEMLTKAAAVELGPYRIRVNAVSPGFVDVGSSVNPVTEEYAAAVSENPLGRRGRPSDIAAAVLFLARPESEWITGAILRVDGGASAGAVGLPLHWPEETGLQRAPVGVAPS